VPRTPTLRVGGIDPPPKAAIARGNATCGSKKSRINACRRDCGLIEKTMPRPNGNKGAAYSKTRMKTKTEWMTATIPKCENSRATPELQIRRDGAPSDPDRFDGETLADPMLSRWPKCRRARGEIFWGDLSPGGWRGGLIPRRLTKIAARDSCGSVGNGGKSKR
jgi:hypothetical protein